ncbi:MAG: AsmA-like C-terminal region-containing protein, partial [Bacteroidota bacterium]
MKKALKIIGIVFVVLFLFLLIAPFLFKGTIEKTVNKKINENLNANVAWSDLDLSFIRSFPDASLSLKELSVINKAPFEGDTLVYAENFSVSLGIMQFFKDEGYSIDKIIIDDALINVKVDKNGNANYDIALESEAEETSEVEGDDDFKLNLSHYEINNSRINYLDDEMQVQLKLAELNHSGDGNFAEMISTLNTHTDTKVTFDYEGTNYLNENYFQLDADLEMDLDKMKFTFLENEAIINQLVLNFDGFYQMNENNQEVDLSFTTPTSDFKNFLALIPEEYAKNLDGVKTSGNFNVDGKVNGIIDDKSIPKLDILLISENASFSYPDLPKTVENIFMDIKIKNETGIIEDTFVEMNDIRFQIDQDKFAGNLKLDDLMGNMLIDLEAKGVLNLSNLNQAYPMDLDMDLNGILMADISTKFDMESIEKERYQNIRSKGKLELKDFHYEDEELVNPFDISSAIVNFDTNNIQLKKFAMKTGKSDLNATGKINNLMGFMLSDQALKGRFKASSNYFAVSDFMEESATEEKQKSAKKTTAATKESIKIPSFLDIVLDFNANEVLYDNLKLTNATGSLAIRNETASLEEVSARIFDGSITLNGMVSTKNNKPTFDMKLGLNDIDIVQTFNQMDLAKNIAPIAAALTGRFSTNFDLKGDLTSSLTPVYETLSGGVLANINQAKVNPEKTPLINNLNNELNFVDFKKFNLKKIQTQATFDNGEIAVKPFKFSLDDIDVNVTGKHRLDSSMDYNLDLKIPAKYLGNEIGNQLANLSKQNFNNMEIDLPVQLSGTFKNPKVNMNLKGAVNDLAKQIIDQQKEDAKN